MSSYEQHFFRDNGKCSCSPGFVSRWLSHRAVARVQPAANGDGILVRAERIGERKPASVLFDRITRRGKPLAVEVLQGLALAKKQGKA